MSPGQVRTTTAAASDVGRKRSGNEDSFALWVSDDSGREHPADTLLVVCDGMGGSNAGEVASRIAVDAVVRTFQEAADDDAGEVLVQAVEAANVEVWEHSRTRTDLNGMGTTCTVVALKGDAACVAHVGDSRAYLVRGGRARQITTDHSLVAQLVARKQLTPDEARHDPRRNVVTRSVGVAQSVEVDVVRLDEPMRPGDTLLVCTDGLHGQVTDDELGRLASGESLDHACRELIQLANQRGGPDNITVAMARREAPADDPYAPPRRAHAGERGSPAKRRALQLLIVALIALLLALCGLAWVVFGMMHSQRQDQTSLNANAAARAGIR